MNDMSIGTNIKHFRTLANLTQRELAEKLGFATGTIQQYELGKREPKHKVVCMIAEALNTSPFCLYGMDPAFDAILQRERNINMAIDFSAFDQKIDLAALQKEYQEAPDNDYSDVPDGTYIIGIDKMEIKKTKAGDKLMFAFQGRIREGDQQNRVIFFNRVITGNKNSERWNDGKAIKSVVTWVNKLIDKDDPDKITFVNYSDLAEQILELYQDMKDSIELEVTYKAKDFNPISILEVYDI